MTGTPAEWQRSILTDPAAELEFPSLGCRLTLAQIYDGIPDPA